MLIFGLVSGGMVRQEAYADFSMELEPGEVRLVNDRGGHPLTAAEKREIRRQEKQENLYAEDENAASESDLKRNRATGSDMTGRKATGSDLSAEENRPVTISSGKQFDFRSFCQTKHTKRMTGVLRRQLRFA